MSDATTLKQANERLEATAAVATVAPPSRTPRWLVSIPHNPELEVEAATREEAVQAYLRRRNIVSTDHRPVVKEVVS